MFKKIVLFLSSYIPLFICFIIILWGIPFKEEMIRYIIAVIISLIILVSVALLWIVFQKTGVGVKKFYIRNVENKTDFIYSYILPYFLALIPLITSNNINFWCNLVLIVFLFVIIFAVYVNSDLLLLNPILTLFGYKYYIVTIEDIDGKNHVRNVIVLSKKYLYDYIGRDEEFKVVEDRIYKIEGD